MISVLMPCYNAEGFLKETIESVLNQSYTDFEFIIINDGSTDSTSTIIKSFEDPRIKFYEKENTGIIDTLNYGFTLCRNNIVARMDADDLCDPDRFRIQLGHFKSETAVLGSNVVLIDKDSKELGSWNYPVYHEQILEELLQNKSPLVHPACMINKDIFNKAGGYDPKMVMAEDYDLWLRISKLGKLSNVPQPLLRLRKHDANVSSTGFRKQKLNAMVSYQYHVWKKGEACISDQDYITIRDKAAHEFDKRNYYDLVQSFNRKKSAYMSGKGALKRLIYLLTSGILLNRIRMRMAYRSASLSVKNYLRSLDENHH